jgi:GT2 family glycosyltransferase
VWHTQIVVRPERYEKDWIASMNMLVMKRAFEATGGFNEKLRTCEDVDFCYRLNKRWKIVYSKNIRAVHYGGAQSLVHLFKKESWRGISNFEGIKSHGFSLQELPSHAVALYYCCALLALPLLLILDHNAFFIVAFTSLLPPGLKSINIVKRARVYTHVLPLMTLLTVYCFARGWSVIRFFLKMYHR